MTISALIIARNEEDRIQKTLESLNFVDEIVVILDRSKDKTKRISTKFTKKIFEGSWECEGKRRNFGISKCSFDWILEIDADEIINKKLTKEIKIKIKTNKVDFFYINLFNYIGKKKIINGWMACLAPDGKFCLFRKGKKSWVNGSVHPNYNLNGIKGDHFKNRIDHYMSKNLSDLLQKFNRNTSLYARDLKLEKNKLNRLFSLRKIFSRFFKSFISRRGFRSGGIGFLIGFLCSIYPFISAIKSKED